MNHDYDKIEENLKKKDQQKRKVKQSGRSVFKLKEIIEKKADQNKEEKNSN